MLAKWGHAAAVAIMVATHAMPARGDAATCAGVVTEYWAALSTGNLPAALNLTTPDVALVWPGNTTLLPMAGTWTGHTGISGFFEAVGALFDFRVCAGPSIMAVGNDAAGLAYATWSECSVLIATGVVPCPNATNQALYACAPSPANASALFVSHINVNIDNACVASAVCAAKQAGARVTDSDAIAPAASQASAGVGAGACAATGLLCPACGHLA
jgi:hypothetical protein